VLVLSCYDDFVLVKEAMKLGAKDYILKPTMEPDQLLEILDSVRVKLAEERDARRKLAEWQRQMQETNAYRLSVWIRQYMIDGAYADRLERELFPQGQGLYSVMIDWRPKAPAEPDGAEFPGCKAAFAWNERQWLFLFGYDKSVSERSRRETMLGTAHALLKRTRREEASGVVGVVCLGPAMAKLGDLTNCVEFHRRQLDRRFYGDIDAKMLTEEAPPLNESPLPLEERNDLLRAVANHNRDAAIYQAERLMEAIRRRKPAPDKLYAFLFELFGLAAGYARNWGGANMDEYERTYVSLDNIRTIDHIDKLKPWLTEAICRLWDHHWELFDRMSSAHPFVRKALQFMRANYHLNIGTVDIANHVRLSRSYLSDLFSKETGESLTETLTRIRIEEAKKKLKSGEMKVYEVAEAVGFSDPKSFAKTFKRLVGCSPKEYETMHR